MLYYSLLKNYNCTVIEFTDLSLTHISSYQANYSGIVYVTDNEEYVGCLGKKEINRSLRENKICINKNSHYIVEKDGADVEARRVFDSNPRILNIPVVDDKKHILYEYKYDYDHYYENADIRSGINSQDSNRTNQIIVSMTSYGKRLDTVHIAIKSLMLQTMKADRILLYIAENDGGKKLVGENELVEAGLEIVRGVKDIGAHKKYYYAMQAFPESIVITADDDQLYDDNTIETLYKTHLKYPEAVVTMRDHSITKRDQELLPYEKWRNEISSLEPTYDAIATGVAGVLYPPGEYRNSFFDLDIIREICLREDDIWLKINELRYGIKTYVVGDMQPHFVKNTQDENALCEFNKRENGNDKSIIALANHYNINLSEYASELDA